MTDSHAERGALPIIADRYEVQVEIGSGAFATTWRGMDLRLGRLVAIKILHAQFAHDPAYVQRFEREAQSAASVSHGNVVDIYDFGRQDDLLYIVMQYVAGEDLKHLIVRERVLPPDRAREIVLQILAGLGAIHTAGIVHRDIKPQNVLVGNDGQVRVADFGIAQVEDLSQLTTAGVAFGTAAYMAPEQADGREIGPATDLYAVGVVLYELLTGTLPFTAPTPMAMMLAHMQETPERPSLRATRWPISGELDAVTIQALQKRPDDRFRSAAAMSQALRNASVHGSWPPTAATYPASMETAAATRPTSMASAQARPVAQPPRRQGPPPAPPAAAVASSGEGGGLSSVMRGFLVLLLVAAAVGAFYVWQSMQGDDPDGPALSPTATATATSTSPAPTQQLIEPSESPTPTEDVATIEPEPSATTAPLPTDPPTIPPTEEAPTIEPIGPDGGTQGADAGSGQGGGPIESMPTPTSPA